MADRPDLEAPEAEGNFGRSLAWIAVAALGTVFTAGAIVGVLIAASEDGQPLSLTAIAIIGALAAILGALVYAQWNLVRRIRIGGGPMTGRERLNRNILVGCGLIGAVMGIVLVASDGSMQPDSLTIFSERPLPLLVAVTLAVLWAGIMPVIAWFWHNRAIDEQEANAYRDGGFYAAYAYIIGAPTWWFLWRGNVLPEPNGVAIFSVFAIIWTAVWYWKKYR